MSEQSWHGMIFVGKGVEIAPEFEERVEQILED